MLHIIVFSKILRLFFSGILNYDKKRSPYDTTLDSYDLAKPEIDEKNTLQNAKNNNAARFKCFSGLPLVKKVIIS